MVNSAFERDPGWLCRGGALGAGRSLPIAGRALHPAAMAWDSQSQADFSGLIRLAAVKQHVSCGFEAASNRSRVWTAMSTAFELPGLGDYFQTPFG